jgi:hypothetical protein
VVSIETDGYFYCYKNKVYLIADWGDHAGSVGRILSIYKNQNEAQALSKQINNSLIFDEKLSEKILNDILQIFPSGDYNISEIEVTYLDQLNITNFKELAVSTVNGYYPYMGCFKGDDLVLTQSKRFLNSDRVKYYENLIKEKVFPKIIVLEESFSEINDLGYKAIHASPRFIVDGHHKLKAYENLNIPAKIILFSHKINPEIGKRNIKNNQALLFDIWHLLEEKHILDFIKYKPLCFIGNNKNIKKYNTLMDNYLRETDSLIYGNWSNLIHLNYKTKDQLKKQWVLDRLKVIYESIIDGSVKTTYLWGDTESSRTGNCFYISNIDDFDLWTKKKQ